MNKPLISDIYFYGLVDWVKISTPLKSMVNDHSENQVYLINFKIVDLHDPNIEPVGMFFESGVRKYVWRDEYWAEVDVSRTYLSRVVDLYHKCHQGIEILTKEIELPQAKFKGKTEADLGSLQKTAQLLELYFSSCPPMGRTPESSQYRSYTRAIYSISS